MNDDFDRDRHQHNGQWFERVAPHSPHYVQCSPDVVPTFEPIKGNMMDVELMSNEELANWLRKVRFVSYDADKGEKQLLSEIETRLRTAMHWLPMTPDAVFEDGEEYFVAMTEDAGWRRIEKMPYAQGSFWFYDEEFEREHFTHYARITEAKQ